MLSIKEIADLMNIDRQPTLFFEGFLTPGLELVARYANRQQSTNVKIKMESEEMFPGMIVIWSGAIVDIPDGWVLCDGNNGTPDLRNLFVVGAGGTYDVDDSDIHSLHQHAVILDAHGHILVGSYGPAAAGSDGPTETNSFVVFGNTNAMTARPPYWALAYIMKT